MSIVQYMSYAAIPILVIIIIFDGIMKKRPIYEDFIDGAKDGIKTTFKIFPTIIAIIAALNLFKESGVMDIFIQMISPIANVLHIPKEVIPIGLMKPISRRSVTRHTYKHN